MASMKVLFSSLRFLWAAGFCFLFSCSESASDKNRRCGNGEEDEQFDKIVALVNPERAKKQERQLDSLVSGFT